MRKIREFLPGLRSYGLGGLLSLLPAVFLAGARGYMGLGWAPLDSLRDWGIVLGALLAAKIGQTANAQDNTWRVNRRFASLLIITLLASLVYALNGAMVLAGLCLLGWYALFLLLSDAFSSGGKLFRKVWVPVLFAGIAGAAPLVTAQVQTRFSQEEFFVVLQAGLLAAYWLLAYLAWASIRNLPLFEPGSGYGVKRSWVSLAGGALLILLAVITLRTYQASFYPLSAPSFPGISAANPAFCGKSTLSSEIFDGETVFQQILSQVLANPQKGTPEYGMLALGGQNPSLAKDFHDGLLKEAQQRLFTTPANSVKSVEYDAALRVYYYERVNGVFPGLFSPQEKALIQGWFNQIARRLQTVEWVDWMYALAYAKMPQGFYENQETGAGLAAVLDMQAGIDPTLAAKNQAYLQANPRGWLERFRNTDDAFNYQPIWITNAYFQSLYRAASPNLNTQLSFGWMLDQALPDGSSLHYNQPGSSPIATSAYLGAILTKDPQLVWLAGKNLQSLQRKGGYLTAQPGVEQAVDLRGTSPTQGSCLLYGDSGLPNQVGPLAPDKLVFRSGWRDGDLYALLDLRFSGWHRYKATNTLSLVYAGQTLTGGDSTGQPFAWLPIGRGQFRDKRIPRENLDGFLVEATGLDGLTGRMTGINPFWAQDPPYYAEVSRFTTDAEVDRSTSVIADWNGWSQTRSIYFDHSGLMVVGDNARGPAGTQAAITWHINGRPEINGSQILWKGTNPAEMLLVPLGKTPLEFQADNPAEDSGRQSVVVTSQKQIQLLTLFMTGDWVGAQASVVQGPAGEALQVASAHQTISIPMTDLLQP